ncbi:hypothetical protein BGZ63DRAFT_401025 [Mariannaea sp. PMI_226]|nr:hypothetical protein BGZ63DRAFT_401025 [Mariannaea sp. PMI_226]
MTPKNQHLYSVHIVILTTSFSIPCDPPSHPTGPVMLDAMQPPMSSSGRTVDWPYQASCGSRWGDEALSINWHYQSLAAMQHLHIYMELVKPPSPPSPPRNDASTGDPCRKVHGVIILSHRLLFDTNNSPTFEGGVHGHAFAPTHSAPLVHIIKPAHKYPAELNQAAPLHDLG